MHTFIDNIITFSLRNKFFIFFCTTITVIAGITSFIHTPIDAFPDVTNTKVTIITQWPGRSAEEIEKFITIPIEIAMNPVQKKTDIRSTTLFGLSVINVMFEDKVDDFFARQQVYNLLNDADLPEGVTPEVQPLYGPTGEIFRYTLRSDKRSVRELKTLQDWVIERKLRAVPGVADIVSFGGEVKTFEVSVNPNQLISYGVTTLELYDAIAKSNINVGGDVITKSSQAYVVRGIGLINDIKEIENIVVKNINGTPILVKHLATVHESSLPRLGQVGRMEEDDVVQGIVVMRKGENPGEVITALKDKIKDIQQNTLPEDVRIVSFYDRENLVDLAVKTVTHNLADVIADSTIGRVAESAACAEKFEREGVGATITVTSCWCYGSETMDMHPHWPKAVWGFNGTERPGAVYLAAVLAGHAQKGLPAFGIYGHDVQDLDDNTIPADVAEKLLRFARAAMAVANMRGKSYLSFGSVCMGIAGSIVDPDFFQEYLGIRNESVDETEILRRMEEGIYDHEEYAKAMAWTEKYCKPNEGEDFKNRPEKRKTREEKDADWEFIVKMTIIMRDLMVGNPKLLEMGFKEEAIGHNAIAAGFQGQRQWTDWKPNGDFSEALLNTTFDWNGIREAYVLATENDACNGVAMLFGHLLSGCGQMFSDIRTYWSPEAVKRVTGKELTGMAKNGIIHLINSGATTLDATGESHNEAGEPCMKPNWEMTKADVEACLKATTWYPADRDYFRGGGFSSNFLSKGGMPVTMMRLNLVKGLGPVLQLAEGWTVDIDPEIHQVLNMRTDPTWPTTWFVPRLCDKPAFRDVYSVMNNWGANHGAISYGHIGQDLITLASMLRIPVCMHNVEDDKIFRPASWNAFGMDKEGSDYRACSTYGPIYK